jgi:hypothetical protein
LGNQKSAEMRVHEVKSFVVRCDGCGKEHFLERLRYSSEARETFKKLGWTTKQTYDCGLTGYTKEDVYCPDCTNK